ncbi:V-type proton ATPase catalytic subunit A [Tanacetum coccineum]
MERGRTTKGMVIATLIHFNRMGASGEFFCLHRGAEYLECYFRLIAFAPYLGSEAFDGSVGKEILRLPLKAGSFNFVCEGCNPTVHSLIACKQWRTQDYIKEPRDIPSVIVEGCQVTNTPLFFQTAKRLREDYLAQTAFTPYDNYCLFYKSVWMMRNIIHSYNLAKQVKEELSVERGARMDGQKITYSLIKHRLGDLFYRLVSQKFKDLDLSEGEDVLTRNFMKILLLVSTTLRMKPGKHRTRNYVILR